jgi:choline dehydrogenase-like flavoprotein
MIYNRGQPADLDTWAQRGNRGWGYADCLPYFRRSENRIGFGEAAKRGRAAGGIPVYDHAPINPPAEYLRLDGFNIANVAMKKGQVARHAFEVHHFLANAGGVTVSYFEWVQDFSSFFWNEDEINARLTQTMQAAFVSIWQVAQDKRVSLRTAAFIVGCTRILQARALRGLYP